MALEPSISTHSVGSQTSSAAAIASAAHKDYLDRLVVPSPEELVRIAGVQRDRETEQRRWSYEQRQRQRRSLEACDRAVAVAAVAGVPSSSSPPRTGVSRGSIRPSSRPSSRWSHVAVSFQSSSSPASSLADRLATIGNRLDDAAARTKAAVVIQRHYRGYRVRRQMRGLGISADSRWMHAIREAQYRELTRPRPRAEVEPLDGPSTEGSHANRVYGLDESAVESLSAGDDENPSAADRLQTPGQGHRRESNARRNWRKAKGIVKHASVDQNSDSETDEDGDDSSGGDGGELSEFEGRTSVERQRERERVAAARQRWRKGARMMGLPYFLEMIDLKHRYGANLRVYHEEWKRADTQESFFYWLDYGEGRHVDMAACPRSRLDREQVRYLSREERQYYLVKINREGRLCWAKNGVPIDTTEQWKDSIHGIVPADDMTPAFKPVLGEGVAGDVHADGTDHAVLNGRASDVSEHELAAARAAKYTLHSSRRRGSSQGKGDEGDGGAGHAETVRRVHRWSATAAVDALLRKSVQKNTWIFVADTRFRLYVGIKDSGAFQHSSFLQGACIAAAGLIKVHGGRLAALSPLSGHYRPPVSNFRAFVQSLREAGVDMRHVAISKAYVLLAGLEAYTKTRRRGMRLLRRLRLHHGEEGDGGHQKDGDGAEHDPVLSNDSHGAVLAPLQKLHIRGV